MQRKKRRQTAADWAKPYSQKARRLKACKMPSLPIKYEAKLTTETLRQADQIFNKLKIGGYKQADKRRFCATLLHTCKLAKYYECFIKYSRDTANVPRHQTTIIDAMVKLKYLEDYRSPPRSPYMSRLRPTENLKQYLAEDPWKFDPEVPKPYIIVRHRETKEELPFNQNHRFVAGLQKQIKIINEVLAMHCITYDKWNEWESCFSYGKKLYPQYYCVFTAEDAKSANSFEFNGRFHTGKFGHQNLLKPERATIRFNGVPSTELDFSGMHPRLLYHLAKIDYKQDPYLLWGEQTTPPMRLMAKVYINCLINARTPQAAASACNSAMNTKTKTGEKKTGKSLNDARILYRAWKGTGLKFAEMHPLVIKYHKPIADCFGNDMGIRLMRTESGIAGRILLFFAEDIVPCLGCHDSFRVPYTLENELLRVMRRVYYDTMGFFPVVK